MRMALNSQLHPKPLAVIGTAREAEGDEAFEHGADGGFSAAFEAFGEAGWGGFFGVTQRIKRDRCCGFHGVRPEKLNS